ncbi:high affinity immunoglobulin epsilon receptor subunit alpha-like [Fundulus heteroclitus]|uniref:high affinity immunoglobulin epsilon receptor subunit alpha-like n=1 Tax=Fundulus heteroclitus TaxID=8078 RepID=UPI00165C8E96|nr:high affinity immunoglobulin epsilon receptor subunit alpha-like [Fundulus heteroclitus]
MEESKLMRKLYKINSTNESEDCTIPAPSCRIDPTFERHSGEYWCENDEGEQSQALNISVTAGSVILEFTAQPVEEGSDVTLCCVNKNEQTEIADFYKDGRLLKTNYENYNLTLQKVSKSDEGFYKCSISGAGNSPESWLAVGEPAKGSDKETQPVRYLTPVIIILLCGLGSVLLVTGLILFKTRKGLINETVTDLNDTTYAVIDKPRMTNGGDAENGPGQATYASVQLTKKGTFITSVVNPQ